MGGWDQMAFGEEEALRTVQEGSWLTMTEEFRVDDLRLMYTGRS